MLKMSATRAGYLKQNHQITVLKGFISWHELTNPEAITQRTEAGYQRFLRNRSLR